MSNMRKLKRVVIKEEFVALTGDPVEAIILNQFIYWTEHMYNYDKYMMEEKERYKNEGKEIDVPLTHGWIYKKAEDLAEEIMFPMSKPTVRKHIANLIEKGYLDERDNPELRWDKTKQYRVNMKKIYDDLTAMGYPFDGWAVDTECGSDNDTADAEPLTGSCDNAGKISGIAEVKNDETSKLKNLTSEKSAFGGDDSSKMPENPKLKNLTPEERNFTPELRNLTAMPEIIYKDYYKEYTTTSGDDVVVGNSNPITGIVPQEEENVKLQSSVKSPAEDSPGQTELPGKRKETDNTAAVIKLKKEIDAVTGGSIALNSVRSLIEHCGENRIRYYTSNFDKFKQAQDINNTVGFFIKAVEEGYPLPVSSAKKNRWADGMMQHTNNFQELEKAIQMRNMQRYSAIKNGCSGFMNDVKR